MTTLFDDVELINIPSISSFNLLHKVNLAPQVTKMLFACDEIIRQHKAACLRVTSMLACNNLIWIGTSAGVVLTVRTVEKASAGMVELPCVTGRWFALISDYMSVLTVIMDTFRFTSRTHRPRARAHMRRVRRHYGIHEQRSGE